MPVEWSSEEFETLVTRDQLTDEQIADLLISRSSGAVDVVRNGIHAYHTGGNISMLSRMMRARLADTKHRVRCPRCGAEI